MFYPQLSCGRKEYCRAGHTPTFRLRAQRNRAKLHMHNLRVLPTGWRYPAIDFNFANADLTLIFPMVPVSWVTLDSTVLT